MFNINYYHFATILAGLLPALIAGIYEAWTSVYLPQLIDKTAEIKFTSSEGSWITVSLCAGGITGSLIYFPIFDKIGRKLSLMTTAIPFLLSSLILAYGKSVITFCLARLLAGIGVAGFCTITPQYFGEISHETIRGALGTWLYVVNGFGILFINVIGTYLDIKKSSLLTFGISVLFLVVFIWVPESPYYLIMTQKYNKAINSLRIFRNKSNVEDEFKRINEAVSEQIKNRGKLMELFTVKSNRKALAILFIVLNAKTLTGDFSYDTYSQTIFNQLCDISPMMFAVIYYSSKLFVIVVISLFIDKIGRKLILLISLLGSAIILLIIAIYLYFTLHKNVVIVNSVRYVMIFVMILFTIFYSFLVSIPVILLSELFPMNVKAFVSFLFTLYYFFSSLLVVKLFQIISDCEFLGMDVAFFAFSISSFVHFVLVYIFVFETKGQTLEAIQKQLQKRSNNEATIKTECYKPYMY